MSGYLQLINDFCYIYKYFYFYFVCIYTNTLVEGSCSQLIYKYVKF